MSSSSKAVQAMGQKGLINTDAEHRMFAGYPNGKGTFGRIKDFLERAVAVGNSNLRLNLFSIIILIIAIVIAVLFKAKVAALVL